MYENQMSDQERSADTTKWSGRYLILVFDCFLVFGIYFYKDIPSALQSQLQDKQNNCTGSSNTTNLTCCSECLGLGPDRYNQLYVMFFWTNAVLTVPAGIMVDRIGNRASSLISSGFGVIGSVLFTMAVSPGFRGSESMFILMMLGRLFIGAATGTTRLVQDRVLAVWFRDKLALSFGVVVSVIRLGSVLNFLVTSHISLKYGLETALWIGSSLCFTCVISAIFLTLLDWYGSKKLHLVEVKTTAKSALGDIRTFPGSFWLVCIMLASFSCYFNGFISNGSKMLEDIYGFDKTTASNINGIFYDISLVFCPVSGQIYERIGLRAVLALFAGLLSIPVLPLIIFTSVSPVVWYIILGILFSLHTISMWPSIAMIVPLKYVGTGNGIAAFMLHASGGVTSYAIGKILAQFDGKMYDDKQWLYVFLLLLGYLFVYSVCGVCLNIYDTKKGRILNRPTVTLKSTEMSEKQALIQDE